MQKFQPGMVLKPSIAFVSSSRWATFASNEDTIPSFILEIRSIHSAGSSGAGNAGRDSWTHLQVAHGRVAGSEAAARSARAHHRQASLQVLDVSSAEARLMHVLTCLSFRC